MSGLGLIYHALLRILEKRGIRPAPDETRVSYLEKQPAGDLYVLFLRADGTESRRFPVPSQREQPMSIRPTAQQLVEELLPHYGMSQAALARELGVNENTVRRWRQGTGGAFVCNMRRLTALARRHRVKETDEVEV